MCFETRLAEGREPACTAACPTGATRFGDRDELIREARRRIDADPSRYVDHIYGLTEAGGTSVLYLSSVPFEQLGFRVLGRDDPYPRLTWEVLSKLPNVVSVGGLMLFGIWWIIQRRQSLATARQDGKMPGKEA
jgi:formate dehydrogenase iron-sulfur subunit